MKSTEGQVSPVGVVLGSHQAPEDIPKIARLSERLGFGALWCPEDYFYTGGIASAGVALAATRRIPVGIGIVSAKVRHPAVLAMELATLSRVYPGRLLPGIGLGSATWLGQMGLEGGSPVTVIQESLSALRLLLDGEELTGDAGGYRFERVRLTHPPLERVPLYLGVIGPRLLSISQAVADGTILSVLASARYVAWAREQIEVGLATGQGDKNPRLIVLALSSVSTDRVAARTRMRPRLAAYLASNAGKNALTRVYGIDADVAEMAARGGAGVIEHEMPDAWLDDLAVTGGPDECCEAILRLLQAGADSVALFPDPHDDMAAMLRLVAAEVLPRLPSLP